MAGTLQVLLLVACTVGLSAADSAFSEKFYLDAERAIFQGRRSTLRIIGDNPLVKVELIRLGTKMISLKSNAGYCPLVDSVHTYCFQRSVFKIYTVNDKPVIEISAYFSSANTSIFDNNEFNIVSLVFAPASWENQQAANAIALNVPRIIATPNLDIILNPTYVEYDLTWIAETLKRPLQQFYMEGSTTIWRQGPPIIVDEHTFKALQQFIQGYSGSNS